MIGELAKFTAVSSRSALPPEPLSTRNKIHKQTRFRKEKEKEKELKLTGCIDENSQKENIEVCQTPVENDGVILRSRNIWSVGVWIRTPVMLSK